MDFRDAPAFDQPDKIEYDMEQDSLAVKERLEKKWLLRMEWLFDHGLITSTDLATLSRVLLASGWILDRTRLPQKLQEKLTDAVGFDDDDEEGGVFPISRKLG